MPLSSYTVDTLRQRLYDKEASIIRHLLNIIQRIKDQESKCLEEIAAFDKELQQHSFFSIAYHRLKRQSPYNENYPYLLDYKETSYINQIEDYATHCPSSLTSVCDINEIARMERYPHMLHPMFFLIQINITRLKHIKKFLRDLKAGDDGWVWLNTQEYKELFG